MSGQNLSFSLAHTNSNYNSPGNNNNYEEGDVFSNTGASPAPSSPTAPILIPPKIYTPEENNAIKKFADHIYSTKMKLASVPFTKQEKAILSHLSLSDRKFLEKVRSALAPFMYTLPRQENADIQKYVSNVTKPQRTRRLRQRKQRKTRKQ